MNDIYNQARQVSEEARPAEKETLEYWREKKEKGRAVIYVSLHRRNLQVETEEEAHDLVKKLDALGVPASVYYYDYRGGYGDRWQIVKESVDFVLDPDGDLNEKKKAPKKDYEVIVDVKTSLTKEKLQDFISRVIGYASARGHKMEIVKVQET